MSGIGFHKTQWNSGIRSQEWRNGYLEIQYDSLLLCMFEHSQNKTFSKMSDQKVQASVPSLLSHQSPPFSLVTSGHLSSCFPNNLWGYSSLCARRAPHCLLPHSWHLDKYLFLTPDGITASSVWSCQHIFSRYLIPGCGNNNNNNKTAEMSWLLPLNNPHPWEQVFPILTMSALWARCFHWLPNNSPVRISQTAVPSGQSTPGGWKAARVDSITILLIISGNACANKQFYGF